MREQRVYLANKRLSHAEYLLQRLYLRSLPRCLGLVLGNACNIDCPHCYQAKNGDNLLKPPEIGSELRREFSGLYPFLSTLRIQGGEAFAYRGFRDIIEDIDSTTTRPLVSVSTNGTLIDDRWAERIVRTPFSNLTVSIDGGTPETYARMRRGADLRQVLANVDRVLAWKQKLNSELPVLDSFFVILRSNFREIPQYLELCVEHGFTDVALQTVEINQQNSTREPSLVTDEAIERPDEVRELHAILSAVLPPARTAFRMVRLSGLQDLFERHGLDARFLSEQKNGLYPDSDDLAGPHQSFDLCPNPWTTLFVAENGGVHLCFLSEPVGNLYQDPLQSIWNSPKAVAKRSDMIAGRYIRSGCSTRWCSWREGKVAAPLAPERRQEELLLERETELSPILQSERSRPSKLDAVRRMLSEKDRRLREFEQLWIDEEQLHKDAQRHIDHLELKAQEAIDDFRALEAETLALRKHVDELEEKLARSPLARLWRHLGSGSPRST